MLVYVLMIILSVIFGFLSDNEKKKYIKYNEKHCLKRSNFFLFCSFIIPFLISALRSVNVGSDVKGTYYNIYLAVLNGNGIRDKGYGLFNLILLLISKKYRIILVGTSFLFNILVFLSIKKESRNQSFSILLFYITNIYFISMNMIRQSLAISIFLFSIRFIKEKKIIKYFICILVASSFHTTAILYLPLYFLYNKKINKKAIVFIPLVILTFGGKIVSIVVSFVTKISFFNSYFAWYLKSQYNTGSINKISLLIVMTLLIFMIAIYKNAHNNDNYIILTKSLLISFCLLILSGLLPLMQRMSWLFSGVIILYIPEMLDYVNNKKLRFLIKNGIICFYSLYMCITIFVLHYHELIPYKFFWR